MAISNLGFNIFVLDKKAIRELRKLAREFGKVRVAVEALDKAKATVTVNAKTKEAMAKLAKVRELAKRLDGLTASIDVDAHTAESAAKLAALRQMVERLDGLAAEVEVDALTTKGRRELEAFRKEVDRIRRLSATVDVEADTGKARADLEELRSLVSRLDGKVATVEAEAQTKKATADLEAFKKLADQIAKKRPTVTADADTKTAATALDALMQVSRRVARQRPTVTADAKTGTATAKLAAVQKQVSRLDGKTATVNVRADTDQAKRDLQRFINHIARKRGGPLSGIKKLLLPVHLSVIGGLATGFGGLAAAATSAGLAIGAFGAVATSVFSVVKKDVQLLGFMTAASKEHTMAQIKANAAMRRFLRTPTSENLKALQKAQQNLIKTLPKVEQKFIGGLRRMQKAWFQIVKALRPGVFKVATSALRALTALFPTVKRLALVAVDPLNRFFQAMERSFKSKGFKRFIETVAHSAPGILDNFTQIILNLGRAFGGLFHAFLPLGTDMVTGLVTLTGKFADFSEHLGQNRNFQQYVQRIRENWPLFRDTVLALIMLLIELLKIAQELTPPILQVIKTLTVFATGIARAHPELVKLIFFMIVLKKTLFGFARPIRTAILFFRALGGAAVLLFGALKKVAIAFRILSVALLSNPIGIVITALVALGVGLFIAYKRSATFRKIVQAAFRGVVAAGKFMWNGLKVAFAGIMVALRAVGGAFMWLWRRVIRPAVSGIAAAVRFLWNRAIKPAFNAIKGAFTGTGRGINRSYTVFIRPVFRLFGAAAGFLAKVIGKAVGFIRRHWRTLLLFLGPAGLIIRGVMFLRKNWDKIWRGITRTIARVRNTIVGTLRNLGARIGGWINNTGRTLRRIWDVTWSTMSRGLRRARDVVVGVLRNLGAKIGGWINNTGRTLRRIWDRAWSAMMSGLRRARNIAVGVLKNLGAKIGGWINNTGRTLRRIWDRAWSSMMAGLRRARNITVGVLKNLGSRIGGWIRNTGNTLRRVWDRAWSAMMNGLRRARNVTVNTLKNLGSRIGGWIRNTGKTLRRIWDQTWSRMMAGLRRARGIAVGVLKNLGSRIGGWIRNTGKTLRRIWDQTWSRMMAGLRRARNIALGVLKNLGGRIGGWIRNTAQTLRRHWDQAWSRMIAGLRRARALIVGALRKLRNQINGWASGSIRWLRNTGHNMIKGMLNGVTNAMRGIRNFLKRRVWNPIVTGVKRLFGIHSPSTVFQGLGFNMIRGLIRGLIRANPKKFVGKVFGGLSKTAGQALGFLINKGKVALSALKGLSGRAMKALGGLFGPGGPGHAVGSRTLQKWIGRALRITHTPMSWLAPLTGLAMHESGGNPKAINLWDSNARAGIPSKGLFQTIDPTFHAFSLGGSIWNPVANAIAAIRYIKSRYGSIFRIPSYRGGTRFVGGYEKGTDFVPFTGMALVHKGERIITADENKKGSQAKQVVINMTVHVKDAADVDMMARRLGFAVRAANFG